MKKAFIIFIIFLTSLKVTAQDNDARLAAQYAANGELSKALDEYKKLYQHDDETYYPNYVKCLLNLKKFDDAESVAKKMIRKHPDNNEYVISLGIIYTQSGKIDKANMLYDNLLKNLPADQNIINVLAQQFYQSLNMDYAIKTLEKGRMILKDDKAFSFELITLYRYKGDKLALTNEYLNFLPSNPAFVSAAENALAAIYEGATDYDMLRAALLKKLQKEPDQTIYTDLLIWQYLQQKDFNQALNHSIALNRRINDEGTSLYELCHTLVSNLAYDAAIRGYSYLADKGRNSQFYIPAKIELLGVNDLKVTSGKYSQNDLLGLEKNYNDFLNEFGRNTNTVYAMQKLANLDAFKLHKLADAQKLLEDAINIPSKKEFLASCKLDMGDVYLINGNQWDATLLYSQVEKDFPNTDIGQDAKFRNAKLAYYTGDFNWAKRQLAVLKAATSQLIANDALNLSLLIADNLAADSAGNALKIYAHADLLIFAEQPNKAVQFLDSIDTKYPGNALANDILMAKARILIQQKDYTGAMPLLKKIVDNNPTNIWADDAVFMLGDIYETNLNDKAQAKIYYQKIISDYPGSLWINEARKRFRLIRGDQPES